MTKHNSNLSTNAKAKSVNYSRLIAMAESMRAESIVAANGTCMTASLEFCALANKLNFETDLVVWQVKDDPMFLDHWAVGIGENQVIDLTRIQIDLTPNPNVIFDLTDYPDNFSKPRFYKTAELLDEYFSFTQTSAEKLPPILIKNLRLLMFKQDLRKINNLKNIPAIISATLAYIKFRINFAILQLSERLQQRLKELTKN